LLEKRGHSVRLVTNGHEALAALQEERFDAVLMDVQMPELDGFETTAAIRARERLSGGHLPVIAMTAHALKGDREKCLAAGMDGYVSKPLQGRELFDAVEGAAVDQIPQEEGETARQGDKNQESPSSLSPTLLSSPPFELAAALQRTAGDRELLVELAEIFCDECPQWLESIRGAVQAQDAAGLKAAAHTLKGAVGNFGATAAFDAAHDLEMMGRRGDLADADDTLGRLQQELSRLLPALSRIKDDG
jgi:CheY-like chemotaxis protein